MRRFPRHKEKPRFGYSSSKHYRSLYLAHQSTNMSTPDKEKAAVDVPGSPSSEDDDSPLESVQWLSLVEPASSEEFSDAQDHLDDDNQPPHQEPKGTHINSTKDMCMEKHLGTSTSSNRNLGSIPSTILAGFQVKRSPWRIDSWVDLFLTLDGRDKVTKFIQYSARLLAWYYTGTAQHERFASLKQSITTSRKAFRFGRSIIELHRLKEHQTKAKDGLLQGIVHAARYFGLAGFWLMDNTNFLYGSGVLDNMLLDKKSRIEQRKRMQSRAGQRANQSYFVGSIAGFWINWKAFRAFQKTNPLKNDDVNTTSPEERTKLQAKYFGLCIALLKSMVDILVFSNNPGVDLWKKHCGAKMNELLHCICGLTSASVVLYKTYPTA